MQIRVKHIAIRTLSASDAVAELSETLPIALLVSKKSKHSGRFHIRALSSGERPYIFFVLESAPDASDIW
jgi:hypothetical protein